MIKPVESLMHNFFMCKLFEHVTEYKPTCSTYESVHVSVIISAVC